MKKPTKTPATPPTTSSRNTPAASPARPATAKPAPKPAPAAAAAVRKPRTTSTPATRVSRPRKPKAAPSAAEAPVPASVESDPVPFQPPAAPEITRIVAQVDVGFGNRVTIRGEGGGLDWEAGAGMECGENGQEWTWETTEAAGPLRFKVLVNDLTWCTGPDLVAEAGATFVFTPSFE